MACGEELEQQLLLLEGIERSDSGFPRTTRIAWCLLDVPNDMLEKVVCLQKKYEGCPAHPSHKIP